MNLNFMNNFLIQDHPEILVKHQISVLVSLYR